MQIVPIKKEKKEVQEKVSNEGRPSKENESKASVNIGSGIFENPSIGDVFKEETQVSLHSFNISCKEVIVYQFFHSRVSFSIAGSE